MNHGTQRDTNKHTKNAVHNNTTASHICFEHIQLQQDGLHIPKELIANFRSNSEASNEPLSAMMMVKQGEILLVTDPKRMSLMRSAEELQFRQDELKEDHSNGILAIVNGL